MFDLVKYTVRPFYSNFIPGYNYVRSNCFICEYIRLFHAAVVIKNFCETKSLLYELITWDKMVDVLEIIEIICKLITKRGSHWKYQLNVK